MKIEEYQKMIEDVGTGIKPDDDWMPTFITEKDGKLSIYGLAGDFMQDGKTKDAAADLMGKIIREERPDSAAFISTAWGLCLDMNKADDTDLDMARAGLIRPAQSPNRIEIVFVAIVDKSGDEMMTFGEIERSGPHPKIKKWNTPEGGPETKSEGRFTEAMKEAFAEIEGKT